jgi:hypothetical protein
LAGVIARERYRVVVLFFYLSPVSVYGLLIAVRLGATVRPTLWMLNENISNLARFRDGLELAYPHLPRFPGAMARACCVTGRYR